MAIRLIALLMSLWTIMPALAFTGLTRRWIGTNSQQPLLPVASNLETSHPSFNYSVGFSLASSYGSAAVIIDTPDGEKETRTWVVHGDKSYRSVMARLSLERSQHLAPPYDEMDEYFKDIPRVMARRLLKKAGLPASPDVGVLASVIKKLRSQIEADLEITISDATLTTTHLEALYQDDVEDVCENAGFQYVIPKMMFQPMLWETSSAYAGYGFGLCENWQNDTECNKERFPSIQVLAVHYSRTALTSSLATIKSAIGALDPSIGRFVSFKLGSDARDGYASEDEYWHAVKSAIVQRMVEFPAMEKPIRIILTGEGIESEFRRVLEEAMVELMGEVPPIFADDALVVAAKGAAEFRRRGKAPWSP